MKENLENHQQLVKQVAEEILEYVSNKPPANLKQDLLIAFENDIKTPVPTKYRQGTVYKDISEFRKHYSLGGVPSAVEPLTKYYYPGRNPHL